MTKVLIFKKKLSHFSNKPSFSGKGKHDLRQMGRKKFGHAKSTDTVATENLGHLLVGDKELLVLRVLEIVFLNVGPELFDAFGTAGFLLANNVSQVSAEFHGFGKSGSLRHVEVFCFVSKNLKGKSKGLQSRSPH